MLASEVKEIQAKRHQEEKINSQECAAFYTKPGFLDKGNAIKQKIKKVWETVSKLKDLTMLVP